VDQEDHLDLGVRLVLLDLVDLKVDLDQQDLLDQGAKVEALVAPDLLDHWDHLDH